MLSADLLRYSKNIPHGKLDGKIIFFAEWQARKLIVFIEPSIAKIIIVTLCLEKRNIF